MWECGQSCLLSILDIPGGAYVWAQMFVFGAGAFGRLGLGNNEDVMYYQPKLCPASLKLKVDKVPPPGPHHRARVVCAVRVVRVVRCTNECLHSGFVQVALGMSFSLVLLQSGELYACGDNSRGQLGSEAPLGPTFVPGAQHLMRVLRVCARACVCRVPHTVCVRSGSESSVACDPRRSRSTC